MKFCNILQLIYTWVKIQYPKFMLLESQVLLETLRTAVNPLDQRKLCEKLEESTKKHGSLGEFRKTTKDVPFCTFLSILPKYARAKVFPRIGVFAVEWEQNIRKGRGKNCF